MTKILITAALKLEVCSLLRRWKMHRLKKSDNFTTYKGIISGINVDLLITGVGLKASGKKLRKCIEKEGYDLIINAGTAGSLSNDLPPKMAFIPHSFAAEDEEVTFASEQYREVLADACRNYGIEYRTGRLYSSLVGVSNRKLRRQVIEKFQAQAVDMEAAAQAAAAQTAGIPFVCLKVITDRAKFPVLPYYFANLPTANQKLRIVLEHFFRSEI